jgi:HAD superfamily hydrolase (TIGR01549 family)
MKEKINPDHIKLTESLNSLVSESGLLGIKGLVYHRLIGQIFYPKNSFNSRKYYLVSVEGRDTGDHIPINLLAEKGNLDDAFTIFMKYINGKYPNIEYSDNVTFNVLLYRNPENISIEKYTMKDILTPKIKHVFFDWSNTITGKGRADELFKTHDKKCLNNGALDLLEHLHSKKIPMGIISNRDMDKGEFESHLTDMDMMKYFDNIILSGDGHRKKPYADMFIQGIRDTGLAPKYILYVGNNYIKDIMGASENGYQTAYKINDKKGYNYNDIANYKISDFKELIDLI